MDKENNLEKNIPRHWSALSYAGEIRVPASTASRAGSWPLYFLKRNRNGEFADSKGDLISFEILQPDTFNFNAQLSVVKEVLNNITADQIAIAEYWGDGPAAKQWMPIVDILIDTYGIGSPMAERIWAAVQAGVNDALLVNWHFKYLWDIARPNQLDQTLATILCTPKHPTYPAGHATVAGCNQMILNYFFPPEAVRLQQLAEECALSRLYAGVHFPADLEQGLRLGRQIGNIVVADLMEQHDRDFTKIDMPITVNLQAKLPPPPYKQVIPFPRKQSCDSLLISK